MALKIYRKSLYNKDSVNIFNFIFLLSIICFSQESLSLKVNNYTIENRSSGLSYLKGSSLTQIKSTQKISNPTTESSSGSYLLNVTDNYNGTFTVTVPEWIVKELNLQNNIFYGNFLNNKNYSVEVLTILFSALIVIRLILGYAEFDSDYLNKAFSNLMLNTYPYLLWICLFFVIFAAAFSQPYFTWGGILAGTIVFVFFWIIFAVIIILLGYITVKRWKSHEENAVSFSKVI